MGNALNSFGDPEFPKDVGPLNDLLSARDLGSRQTEVQAISDVTELSDPFAAHGMGSALEDPAPHLVVSEIVEESRLHQVLEQARLATDATGAAFGNPEFLKDVESRNDLLSVTDLGPQQPERELSDSFAAHRTGATFANRAPDLFVNENIEEFHLSHVLEQACLATGATGAAIALVRGEEIVCCATTGSDAPSLGICLDPHTGLSGLCIQTRQLQHCTDIETDPRVNPEASRILGVRSIAVLPLMDGGEFLGIFEILSPRPHAFGEGDLRNFQALSARILENRRQERESTAPPPNKRSGAFLHSWTRPFPRTRATPQNRTGSRAGSASPEKTTD